jgi:sugar phosphate isomerase/epimerase
VELKLFRSLWGVSGDIAEAVRQAATAGFHGIEGPAPALRSERESLRAAVERSGLLYIAKITTAGSYVPERWATLDQHLETLRIELEHSAALDPLFVTCLGGCDAWPETKSIDFFGRAIELARAVGLDISFETHRGCSLFNPWTTQRILSELPEMQITCDLSHWCVVCERLMDSEIDVIRVLAPRARHIHARVGYEHVPQIPHPAAPEYAFCLRAHQRWWEILWRAQRRRGFTSTTLTPEFGPDGYLYEAPFTGALAADLWEQNRWMAEEEDRHFRSFFAVSPQPATGAV